MSAKYNLNEHYFRVHTPLLDEDFDLSASEVTELVKTVRKHKDTGGYLMKFEP